MAEINESLSTYLDRIERLEEQFLDKDIVVSSSLRNEILLDGEDDEIQKEPILWRLHQYNMFYVVRVPKGTTIQRHRHDEAVFRFVTEGSLILNDEHEITSGMWFVVKAETPYEVRTEEGYVAIAAYQQRCKTRRMTAVHRVKTVDGEG